MSQGLQVPPQTLISTTAIFKLDHSFSTTCD